MSNKNSKSRSKQALPNDLPLEVIEAVLEDTLLEAVADAAALAATEAQSSAMPVAVTLQDVPFLGPVRIRSLAASGIRTLAELQSATTAQIGSVKGVGLRNAEHIKDWLASHGNLSPASSPPEISLASTNQQVQEIFGRLDSAATKLKEILPPKTREKGLEKQIEKIGNVASELAEGPDTLSAKQIQQALKTLDKIAALLDNAIQPGKLTPKKQAALTEELRARRKRLQKALDD